MRRRAITLTGAVVVALSAALGFFIYRSATSQSQQQWVLRINGTPISAQRWAGFLTRVSVVRQTINPSWNPPPVKLFEDEALELQEARRRGITCSTQDAQTQLQDNLRLAGSESFLAAVIASGFAPVGYDKTPAALRTPDTSVVIETYMRDPNVIRMAQDVCTIGRLFAQVRGPAFNMQGVDPAAELVATLEANATVEVGTVPTFPPVPTATLVPTQVSSAGCTVPAGSPVSSGGALVPRCTATP